MVMQGSFLFSRSKMSRPLSVSSYSIMTFRRSLYLSIAMHLLIFSSAVAVAQYAAEYFVSPRVIPVSLISLAPGSRGESGPIKHQSMPPRAESPQPVDISSERLQAVPSEVPSDVSTTSKSPEMVSGEMTGVLANEPRAGIHGQTVASAGTDQRENTHTGALAPQQWTAIQNAIERTKNYPRLARERGIEGEVRLRFKINSAGLVESVEVVKSSGYEILDSASIHAVYRAAPLPAVNGWIEVPIAYVLK